MNFRVGFNFYGSQKKKNNNKKTAPSFQTTESQDALPRYDSQAGFCWFALGCLGLDSVLLRHLWDLPFKKADIQSRLSGSWLALRGEAEETKAQRGMDPNKTSRCRLARASLLRSPDKDTELTDSILLLTGKEWNFLRAGKKIDFLKRLEIGDIKWL